MKAKSKKELLGKWKKDWDNNLKESPYSLEKPLGKNDVMMNKVAGLPVYAFYMSDGWNRVDDLKERCHICGYPANIVWKVKHSEAHQNCRDEYYLCEVCISFVDMLHSFDNFVMRSYIEQTQKRMNESYEQGKKDERIKCENCNNIVNLRHYINKGRKQTYEEVREEINKIWNLDSVAWCSYKQKLDQKIKAME